MQPCFGDLQVCFEDLQVCFEDLQVCFEDLQVCFGDLQVCFGDSQVCFGDFQVCFGDLLILSPRGYNSVLDLYQLCHTVFVTLSHVTLTLSESTNQLCQVVFRVSS